MHGHVDRAVEVRGAPAAAGVRPACLREDAAEYVAADDSPVGVVGLRVGLPTAEAVVAFRLCALGRQQDQCHVLPEVPAAVS